MKVATPRRPRRPSARWYQGIGRYQWLVLIIASAGWVFDIYEGQIFNTTRADLLSEMIKADSPAEHQAAIKSVGDAFQGIFLAGGMVGGILFGALGDRWGRKPAMILTILMAVGVLSGLTFSPRHSCSGLACCGFWWRWGPAANGPWPRRWWPTSFHVTPEPRHRAFFRRSSTSGTWMATVVAHRDR